MNSVPVNVVDFAPAADSTNLRRHIFELGYPVRTLEAEAPGRITSKALSGILVVVFDGRHVLDAALQRFFDQVHRQRKLGVIRQQLSVSDLALAERCGDLCFWPCSRHELKYRIDRLCTRYRSLTETPELQNDLLKLNFVGQAPAFKETAVRIRKFAACDVPVLIQGETGTGKELAARALHYLGPRKDRPFVPVNCGALPENLIENELFGHRRGAFTDARSDQRGLVVQAQGGTLFLDEIDTLTPSAQAALLRFLQAREYRPLGAEKTEKADLRIVAASNQPLERLVESNRFRRDLLYRLNIMPLRMPPLRERRGDIVLLAEHFLRRFREEYDAPAKRLSAATIETLEAHSWPGNVRELENCLHRAFLMSDGDDIHFAFNPDYCGEELSEDDLVPDGDESGEPLSFAAAKTKVVEAFERRYLQKLLALTEGNVSRAARLADKERRALGKLLRKHGIDRLDYVPEG
jgi:DNA-binding NtrC family response regulator